MISTHHLFEGIIRGISTIPYRHTKELIHDIRDSIKISSSPKKKIAHIKKILHSMKIKFKEINIDLKDNQHQIIDHLSRFARWRHYVILNDEVYKKIIDDILNDKKGKNSWVDISYSKRKIQKILDIKNNKDVDEILNIYNERIKEIEKLIQNHSEKWGEFNKLLNWGLHGLRDMFNTIHAVVSYGSKGL